MYNTYSDNITGAAIAISVFVIAALFIAAFYIISSWLMMKIFKKAGIEGWKAWVPVLNSWTFFELGGYHGALSLIGLLTQIDRIGYHGALSLIGLLTQIDRIGYHGLSWVAMIAYLVLSSMVAYEISKKLQKPDSAILYPLGIISLGITTAVWYFQMAFTQNPWNDSLGKESLAKGTILGYQVVEEEAVEAPSKKTKEKAKKVEE